MTSSFCCFAVLQTTFIPIFVTFILTSQSVVGVGVATKTASRPHELST
ncbi:MAG: hypothetical protein GY938_16570 [Ketobacter sp.]|nr:hypothetical protein [Ketobacter sp.]